MPFILGKTKAYKKKIKETCAKNKGFFKKPLFWLGAISFIFLIFPSFGGNFILKENNCHFSEEFIQTNKETGFLPKREQLGLIELNIIQRNSLKANYSPNNVSFKILTSLINEEKEELSDQNNFGSSKEIIEYIVEKGDTISSLSQKFGISVQTILWANNLSQKSNLKAGQKIIILPISGVLHYVKKGDTLGSIAKKYKADLSEIIAFNEISSDGNIYIGDILVVPNGIMPVSLTSSSKTSSSQIPLASGYFIIPVSSPYLISQGLHWYNAVDFTHPGEACGKPIFAAAGGQVLKISYGWNMGAGNYLKILHPNGIITMYGHLQTILVKEGDNVSQGQLIALMGGQPGMPGAGKSTGCHLHFSVQGANNPFAR